MKTFISIFSIIIGILVGCLIFKYYDDKPINGLDTVQKRALFKLGLLWDDKDTQICKTKNYVVKVKILGGCDKAYYGLSQPMVSINGDSFVKAKVYGDFLSDRQEWVFYHDASIRDYQDFTVRFDWYRNQEPHSQCYFETEKDNKTVYEYGDIIHQDR